MNAPAGHQRIYLDTNIFIQAFETAESSAEPIQQLLGVLRAKSGMAVTSELTLAELLAPVSRPGTLSRTSRRRLYLDLLIWSNFIELRPVTREVLIETADLRDTIFRINGAKMSLPDAIHVVTAVQAHSEFFLSSDERLARSLPTSLTPILADAIHIAKLIDDNHAS